MKKPTRYYSSAQEEHVAKALGGKTQPNSGATPFFKGDVIAKDFVVECKTSTTCKESFSIKREWLDAINKERIEMRKPYCALAFQFCPQGQFSKVGADKNYYVVDEYTFKAMFDALMALENKR